MFGLEELPESSKTFGKLNSNLIFTISLNKKTQNNATSITNTYQETNEGFI